MIYQLALWLVLMPVLVMGCFAYARTLVGVIRLLAAAWAARARRIRVTRNAARIRTWLAGRADSNS